MLLKTGGRRHHVERRVRIREPLGIPFRPHDVGPLRDARVLTRLLVGPPISTERAHEERLTKTTGLAVLSSDALSSVAYATEEVLRVLMLGGLAAMARRPPVFSSTGL